MKKDKDLDLHYWHASPASSVHAQRPGKDLQAKQSESLRAQDSAIQKPDQNRSNMSHSLQSALGTKPYIQLLKWTFDSYEVYKPKQSESLRAQDSAIQKPDQNINDMSHNLYNHSYALNHIQLVK